MNRTAPGAASRTYYPLAYDGVSISKRENYATHCGTTAAGEIIRPNGFL